MLPMPGPLDIRLLGTPVIEVDGTPLRVDTRKATALLAYLAVTARPHEREHLAALLWPDYPSDSARASLRRTLSTLSTALGKRWVTADREQVTLAREGVSVDVRAFQRMAESPDELAAAADLWRGRFLEGFVVRDAEPFEEWQFFVGEELQRVLARTLERVTDRLADAGQLDAAITYARRWLRFDPLHEPAHRRLIQLYAATGQRGAALRQYRECVRALHRELGVAPLEETTAIYHQLREGSLPAAAPARGSHVDEPGPKPPPTGRTSRASDEWPLVGRADERARLLASYADVRDGGLVAVIDGEPGIGKTRLAGTFMTELGRRGAETLSVRCYPGERELAYAPVAALLREALQRLGPAAPAHLQAEAGRLLSPGVDRLAAAALSSPGARDRFLAAVAETVRLALAGEEPGLLWVDDAHWADDASLDALAYLSHRIEAHPFCLLLTWGGEAGRSLRLRPLLGAAQRAHRAITVTPRRLSVGDVEDLVGRPPAVSAEVLAGLYQETRGVPLLVVEYLAAVTAGGHEDAAGTLPVGVREVLLARTAGLSGQAAQAMTAAAVIGRDFDAALLRAVSGRGEEEMVAALEELVEAGVAVETLPSADKEATGYELAHPRLRELVYEETSLARRRLLHGRVAHALWERHRRNGPAHAARIATHAELAGQEEQAARLHALAATHARSLGAHGEALEHLRSALALGHPDAWALQRDAADLLVAVGDYSAALEALETAASGAPAEDLPRLEHRLALVHTRRREWGLASAQLDTARVAARDRGDEPLLTRILADLGLVAHHQGRRERAHAHARGALELAERLGDDQAVAQACNVLGILARDSGRPRVARECLERSLAIAEARGDAGAQVAALNNLSRLHLADGRLVDALGYAETALARCRAEGDRHHEAALHSNLAEALQAAGRVEAAREHVRAAAEIVSTLGGQEHADEGLAALVSW